MRNAILMVTADTDNVDEVKLKFAPAFTGLSDIARADLLKDLLHLVTDEYNKAVNEAFRHKLEKAN